MLPNAIIIENINGFFTNHRYFVKNFTIHEALSEVNKYILELVIIEGNLWDIHIPLHHQVTVTINYWIADSTQFDNVLNKALQQAKKIEIEEEGEEQIKQREWTKLKEREQAVDDYIMRHRDDEVKYKLLWSRTLRGFTSVIKKTFGDEGTNGVRQPILIIEFRHRLFELNYDTQYRIHKYRTHSEIIESNCTFKDIVVFNECLLMHIERFKMFNQFGENDLHLFQRLVQYYGAFFYCHDNGFEVTIHDTILAYVLMFPSVNTYEFDIYNPNMTNKIFSIQMEEHQVPRVYHTMDYNIRRDHNLIGYSYRLDGYGIHQTYPANRSDFITVEQQAINIKKRFVKKKYKGSSGCYDMRAGQRIIINGWANNTHHVIIDVKHKFSFNIDNSILYVNDFMLHEHHDDSYVSDRDLPQPLVPGMQTATVRAISPIFEIETSREGEVFVEFHWLKNIPDFIPGIIGGTVIDLIDAIEFYSCWIPVAQVMAGRGCGSYIIPRVGDEVLVYFINGNPNRPIIFGALHNDRHREFILDRYDHFKIVLMRSRTFYQLDILDAIPNYSFNEISMCDIPFAQRLYLKAEKDLIMHIGHERLLTLIEERSKLGLLEDLAEDTIFQNNFETHVYGKGHQKHFIQNGGYYLDVMNGVAEQNVHGNYMINVYPSEMGMDMTINIREGQLIINAAAGSEQKYGADLIINVTGDCNITTEGETTIESVGSLNLISEESITLTAPTITLEAESLIAMNAGEDITMDAGEAMEVNVGTDLSIEVGGAMEVDVGVDIEVSAGAAIEVSAGADISVEAGGAIEVSAGADIAIEAGVAIEVTAGADIAITAAGAIEETAAADIAITAGVGIEVTAGVEVNICAPVLVSIESALEVNLTSGVSMTFESGVDMNFSSGIVISGEAGIDLNWAGGICAAMEGGITADVLSGIASTIDSGIETAVTAGINTSSDAGIFFDIHATLLGTAKTAIEVFVRRPRIF